MAEKETKTVETKVEQVDVDLNDIFNAAPGGDSITLPEETTEKKPNIFSRKKDVDTSFLYETKKEEPKKEEVPAEEEVKNETVEEKKETVKKDNVIYFIPYKSRNRSCCIISSCSFSPFR